MNAKNHTDRIQRKLSKALLAKDLALPEGHVKKHRNTRIKPMHWEQKGKLVIFRNQRNKCLIFFFL